MCFAPQRRAIFRHLNFQKWSKHGVLCTSWVENALGATVSWTSKSGERMVWFGLYILTCKCAWRHSGVPFCDIRPTFQMSWKCASRHSGVQFFISPLATWLRTRRFSEPTFPTFRPTNPWKNTAIRDFPNTWCDCIFFLLAFAHLYLLSSDSTSLLCSSSLHIVGSLTSKLPLIMVVITLSWFVEKSIWWFRFGAIWTYQADSCFLEGGWTMMNDVFRPNRFGL